ncbi:tannase and feruloyl esterase-domain-containing protein [Dactylonectria estremocensis]|uniref:Carboxylic ester hydrolase n=1 Tax=Dactylonectria estremocensis TaxID=1079267 RepID=A0A9P9FDF7_9HYPO|nr:tannase and feruloyl esterase-domain-containing protein [Dactylonectria estremocensis]
MHLNFIFHVLVAFVSFKTKTSLECNSSLIPYPTAPGVVVQSLTAVPVTNFSRSINEQYGQHDTVNVQIWLPDSWNGRFLGTGGGGFAGGEIQRGSLALGVSQGYATVATDGGHDRSFGVATAPWAQVSPFNMDQYALHNFASISLLDMTVLGKSLTTTFYGSEPRYSYWNCCSTGGRQGFMLVQRYPGSYDGILAAAPGINWDRMLAATVYPQVVMNNLSYYPNACELNAISSAIVAACDGDDGAEDGILSAPRLCNFNYSSIVGTTVTCEDGDSLDITSAAVQIAESAYNGPHSSSGEQLWFGPTPDSPLTVATGLAVTTCTSNNNCTGASNPIGNPDFTLDSVEQQYLSIIGTSDPDLSVFKATGGKILTWHGLMDEIVPSKGTTDYYSRVEALDLDVRSFFKHFEAPVRLVEDGESPEVLPARSEANDGTVRRRNLCPWPLEALYKGGDPALAESFECGMGEA